MAKIWRRSGRTAATIERYAWWLQKYFEFCSREGLDVTGNLTPAGAALFARQYAGPRTRHRNSPAIRAGARSALRAWSWALRLLGRPVPDWHPSNGACEKATPTGLLGKYAEYRQRRRGVAQSTLSRDIDTAALFLKVLQSRTRTLATARVTDLDAFVAQVASRVSKRTTADTCSSLRAFLRFLHVTGRIHRDLASCVVAPRVRPMARPPRALPWADVRRVLRAVDLDAPRGRRDFAILLLAASCGLGSAEVCALRLDDIKWGVGALHVRRQKTGVQIELPLLPAVARALAGYIRYGRPQHAVAREVFVTAALPHRRLTTGALRHILRKHARAAGITAEVLGMHALRHSHASRQIDIGALPKVVGDILGHLRPSSTSVYVRVAVTRLRAVGLSVPR